MMITRTLQLGSAYAGATLVASPIDTTLAPVTLAGFSATFTQSPTSGTFTMVADGVPADFAGFIRVSRGGAFVGDLAVSPPSLWEMLTSGMITPGSIGKLIRDYLGGDSKVMATVAAADGGFSTNDRESLNSIAEELADPENGGAVMVLPPSAADIAAVFACGGVPEIPLSCLEGEAATWMFPIVERLGPLDLTGRELSFVVRDKNYEQAFAVGSGDGITVAPLAGGTVPSVATVTLTAELTARRDYVGVYVLWDLTNDKVLARGSFKIDGAVKDVT